jgi:predicted alpha/beta superfamily hydrolase
VRIFVSIVVLLLAACSSSPGTSPPDASPDRRQDAPLLAPDSVRPPDARADQPDASVGPKQSVLRVHYPSGTHTFSVRGSAGPLSWTQSTTMTAAGQDTWTLTSTAVVGTIEWKPLLDDKTWAIGPNYHITAGQTVDVYPHFTVLQGQVSKLIASFTSTVLPSTRDIWVYLPPTYLENSAARMPVVYMHDGQNLFDPALAFGGNPWKADKAVDAAATMGTCPSGTSCTNDGECGGGLCQTFREAIIIGISNTAARMDEYTPVADPDYGGGKGDLYLKMLVDELKPKVDTLLRTRPEPEHTAMIGSSLGGLITSHAGVTQAGTFGLVGPMSPSTWWDATWIITEVAGSKGKTPRPLRVYLDSGDAGVENDDVTNTNKLADTYLAIGYVEGQDFHHVIGQGDQHNEIYWAKRLPGALSFLLGPR